MSSDALFSAAVKHALTAHPECGMNYRTGLTAWETTVGSMRQDTGGGEETVEEESRAIMSLTIKFHHFSAKTLNSLK